MNRPSLTAEQWARVAALRADRLHRQTARDIELLDRAYEEDPARYLSTDDEIPDAGIVLEEVKS